MNVSACASIRFKSVGGTSPVRLSQIAKLLWRSEWRQRLCASSFVKTPFRIIRSIRLSMVTANAASWPLIRLAGRKQI